MTAIKHLLTHIHFLYLLCKCKVANLGTAAASIIAQKLEPQAFLKRSREKERDRGKERERVSEKDK